MDIQRFTISLAVGFLLFFASICNAIETSPLDPQTYLWKIKNRIRGDWPEPEEIENLDTAMKQTKCQEVACLKDYFSTVIKSYMQHPNFYGKMALKVNEMLWLKPAKHPYLLYMPTSNPATNEKNYNLDTSFANATEELIRRIFIENLSWDELYKSKKYKLFMPGDYREYSFFDRVYDMNYDYSKLGFNTKFEEIDLSQNPNAAGVFTTQRFLSRYWNNSLNQNRKRAAAVFRIMLCDSMMPSIERKLLSAQERQKAFGLTEQEISEIHSGDQITAKHASDPACNKCHQRLDPLAWTMRPLEFGISSEPFKGRLRYYKNAEELTDINVDSFSDMINKMTVQDLYRKCQVDQFLKWTIGKDIVFSESRRLEIENKFDQLGRRPKDFIEYLLLSPEFGGQTNTNSTTATASELTTKYTNAMLVFNHCNECHGSLPISKNEDSGKNLLRKISLKLDLKNNGLNREMPPPSHSWQPTSNDIETIKKWIESGAPNSNGQPSLTPSESKNLILEGSHE